MKKLYLVLTALIVASMILTACGQATTAAPTEAPGTRKLLLKPLPRLPRKPRHPSLRSVLSPMLGSLRTNPSTRLHMKAERLRQRAWAPSLM